MSGSDARSHFTRAFGGAPDLVVSAPGRVNLIGEHTDYSGGEVLPIAIGLRTWVAVRARAGAAVSRLVSGGAGGMFTLDHARLERMGRWTDYVGGVLSELIRDGVDVPALDVAIASDLPSGGGLSSSAALEVSTAFAIRTLLGAPPDRRATALLCQRAERDFVGVPCGAMDQLSSALGGAGQALHVDCATIAARPVTFAEPVLVIDTSVPRSLRRSAYNDRVRECGAAVTALRVARPSLDVLAHATLDEIERAAMAEVPRRRARHVVSECARVRAACAALECGAPFPGDLAFASHASLRDDFEASCAELDWIVERARTAAGIRGARLTGAGWGGCAVVFGESAALEAFHAVAAVEYDRAFGRRTRGWIVRASDGVRVE